MWSSRSACLTELTVGKKFTVAKQFMVQWKKRKRSACVTESKVGEEIMVEKRVDRTKVKELRVCDR